MSYKHTPGPWTLKPGQDYGPTSQQQGYVQRPGGHTIETNIEDARLIAAAPDLLGALDGWLGVVLHTDLKEGLRGLLHPHERALFDEVCEKTRAAIRKARGE